MKFIKISMPVFDPSLKQKQDMYEKDNVLIAPTGKDAEKLSDNPSLIKEKGKKVIESAIREFGDGIMQSLFLPKIYKVDPRRLLNIGGKNIFILEYEKPQKTKKGYFMVYDIDAHKIDTLDYDTYYSEIEAGNVEYRRNSSEEINKVIKEYNSKLDSLDKAVGLQTIVPRIMRTQKFIEEREAELKSQKDSFDKQGEQNNAASFSSVEDYFTSIRQNLVNNNVNPQDLLDNLVFLYRYNIDKLSQDLFNGTMPIKDENLKENIKNIAIKFLELDKNAKVKEDISVQNKEDRMNNDLPEWRAPEAEPLNTITPEDLKAGISKKLTGFKAIQAIKSRDGIVSENLSEEINILNTIKSSLNEIFNSIKSKMGDLSKERLATPEGQEFIADLKNILQTSYIFIKKYVEFNTPVKFNDIQTKVIGGNHGGMGNIKIAVELNRLFNSIQKSILDNTDGV